MLNLIRVPPAIERKLSPSARQFLEFAYPYGCWGQTVRVPKGYVEMLAILMSGDSNG